MVLSIIVILFVLLITYFHYVQGFFSATLSAVAAVLAAVLAVSYDETLVRVLLRGAMADQIHAIVLVALFVAGYVVLRVLFDKAVPGNVRTPATIDKVGAALMGVVAGSFATGIFVIAAQMLPFGPTISFLGYARMPLLEKRAVIVPGAGHASSDDSFVAEQMADDTFDLAKEKGLLLPVDDLVMNTVYHLSDGGSLAGTRTLSGVHPDWLAELFGQRLGIQTGSRHVTLALPGTDPVGVAGIYTASAYPAVDDSYKFEKKSATPETEQLRPAGYKSPYGDELKATPGLVPLVVRFTLRSTATDDADHLYRFSPGSVRLVTRQPDPAAPGEFTAAKDHFMVGTLEGGKTVLTNRPDDFLVTDLANGDGGFDAVFLIDRSALVAGPNKSVALAPGTFAVVKRLAILDLSGMTVHDAIPPAPTSKVRRTDVLREQLNLPADAESH